MMFNMFGKPCYHRKRLDSFINADGVQIETFDEPTFFDKVNYQEDSNSFNLNDSGESNDKVYNAIFPILYLGQIKLGDRFYLIDDNCCNLEELNKLVQEDNEYGNNANYKVENIKVQNLIIIVKLKTFRR